MHTLCVRHSPGMHQQQQRGLPRIRVRMLGCLLVLPQPQGTFVLLTI